MQVEFAQQEQNDPTISPVSNTTTIYNAIESTATANVPTTFNTTRPTSECKQRYGATKQSNFSIICSLTSEASASAITSKPNLKK